MTRRYGLDAAVFSAKCCLAALLAIWFALRIGLERPYWAFMTSYIVAQPLAAAVTSKALFRAVGTLVGAMVTVLLVPALSNSPELLVLAIGGWLGICVFVSLLDRTPRAYMFVLAGYSAIIIGLPTVEAPATVFTVAATRVQEILIGIGASTLVHALVLPESVSEFLLARVAVCLADAERWSRDSLVPLRNPALDAERRRLAQDVTELHQLSIHLPFETSRLVPRIRTVRAMQDQLSLLMPLGAAVADRVAELETTGEGLPPAFAALLAETHDWLERLDTLSPEDRSARAEALIAACAAHEPAIDPASSWGAMVRLSLASRLGALIAAHRDCRDLADQLASPHRRPVNARVAELLEGRRDRELHVDVAGAARGALCAMLTVIAGSALWILTGWNEGATAVMLGGVFLALFSASVDPAVPLRAFFWGTLMATILGGTYSFVIMPRLDGFAELALAFTPPLLLLGALIHSPRHAAIALPTLIGLASPLLISASYVSDFEGFINGAIAQLAGVAFAIVMVRLLHSAGVEQAIARTIRAGWQDIAERAPLRTSPDLRAWINRMLDRIALLAPRLAVSGRQPGEPLFDALRDLRTGVAIGELKQLRVDLEHDSAPADDPARLDALLGAVLGDVSAHYRALVPGAPVPAPPALLARIDAALGAFVAVADQAVRRAATLGLVSLRRNLFPAAPAPALERGA